jgi:hypothetical protein
MGRSCFSMLNIKQSKKFIRKFVNKLLPAVSVILCRDAEFTKPFIENGLCHGFGLLVLDLRVKHVLLESASDAQDVFVMATGCQHGYKQVSMNPDIGMFWIWKWL